MFPELCGPMEDAWRMHPGCDLGLERGFVGLRGRMVGDLEHIWNGLSAISKGEITRMTTHGDGAYPAEQ